MATIYDIVIKELETERDPETQAARLVAVVDLLRGYEQDIIGAHEYLYHDDEPEQRGNLRLRLVVYAFVITYLSFYPLAHYAPRLTAFCWLRWLMFLAVLVVLIVLNILGALWTAWRAGRTESEDDGAETEDSEMGTSS